MGIRVFERVALLAVLFSTAASAQSSVTIQPALQRDQTALALLTKATQSAGVTSAQPNTTATGTVTFADGTAGTITIQTLDFNSFRTQTTSQGSTTVMVVNGNSGFRVNSGTKRNLPVWVAESMHADSLPFSFVSSWMNQPGFEVLDMGLDSSSGTSLSHIHIEKPSDGTPLGDDDQVIYNADVYIDPTTNTISRIHSRCFGTIGIENSLPRDVFYSDYRQVGGMLIPFHMRWVVGTHQDADIVFDSVASSVGNSSTILQ